MTKTKVHAKIRIGESNEVNAEVCNELTSWNTLWVVGQQVGAWGVYFLVSARHIEDAIDEWAGYCADHGMTNFVSMDPVADGWVTAEEFDPENPDKCDLSTADGGLYYTGHEVTCWKLSSLQHELESANAILWFENSKANQEYFGEPMFKEEEFLQGLADELRHQAEQLGTDHIDKNEDPNVAFSDVRLYLRPNIEWETCSGLSDYDTDHRGWCGASSIRKEYPESFLCEPKVTHHLEEAKDLLNQVQDVLYDGKPSWLIV